MRIFTKELNKKLVNTPKEKLFSLLYLLGVTFSFLLIFLFKHELGSYLLFAFWGFGWALLLFKKSLNWIELLFISPAVFLSLLLSFFVTTLLIGFSLGFLVYGAFFLISIAIFIKVRIFSGINLDISISKWDLLMIILFGLLFVSKIISVSSFEVPALHDPITHAYFAKKILNDGIVEFFYSPGLHIFSSFAADLNSFWVGKQILFVTNFFNMYLPFVIYVFLRGISKNKYIPIIAAVLFAFGYYPSIFFLQAGKNALVTCLPILVFFFWLIMHNRGRRDWKLYLLSNLVLFSLFLIHYPTAVFGCIFLFVLFILDFRKNSFKNALNAFGFIPGILWMLVTYPFQSEIISNSATLPSNEVFIKVSENISETFSFYYIHMINLSFIDYNSIFVPVSILGFFGLLFMIIVGVRKKELVKYCTLPISAFLSAFIAFLIIYLNLNRIYIVFETLSIIRFLFLYIGFGFLVGETIKLAHKILNKAFVERLFVWCVLLFSPILAYKTYQLFLNTNNERNVISEKDIEVFNWIGNNIEKEKKILINAVMSNGYIYSSDGGGWLEVYTDNPISMPFYDYGSKETYSNFDNYNLLKTDFHNCESLQYMRENGIFYYYQGALPVFGPYLGSAEDLQAAGWKVIFSSGDAALFEMPICEL